MDHVLQIIVVGLLIMEGYVGPDEVFRARSVIAVSESEELDLHTSKCHAYDAIQRKESRSSATGSFQ